MFDKLTFKRKNLAEAYCDSLVGKGIVDATSGLFLAGPRRVGKSTFLIEDLIPEAQDRQWLPVYVDLWSNKITDPALLITEAIKAKLTEHKSKFSRFAEKTALQIKILKILEFDFSKPGLPDNLTMADFLSDLVQLSEKPVLLIIDEAQHALSTEQGINTMFAIKSARDQINLALKSPNLMLVLTGSNRDKLAQLVIKKDQPFFGSEITAFPLLGHDFTDFFTKTVNESLVQNNQFNEESVWEVFQLIGHRPEILRQIIGRAAINHEAKCLSSLLKQDAVNWQSQVWGELESEFNTLPPLHRCILALLIKEGRAWSPFSEESMQYYKKVTNQSSLNISSVQTAIQTLREKGFIWQSSRGSYALEDESFAEWFEQFQASK